MADQELTKIQERLAEADAKLVEALDARARAVRDFVALREARPDAYHALPSASEVVGAALEASEDFPPVPMEKALREVLGACAKMVAPVRVSLVGPEGGFAHVAALNHFGSSAEIVALDTVAAVFEEVERKRSQYGVVPFETSTDGAQTATLRALVAGEARICGEITIGCSYDLVSSTGNAADVENIYGTATALEACARTIRREFAKATVLEVQSGSVAAELAAEDHGAAAVLADWSQTETRDLRRIRERIEDRLGVDTRFVVVGHERPKKSGTDRTVIALGVGDAPGSLYHALQPLAERGINLTRIESRSSEGAAWRYIFVLELDGHITDRPVLTAVDEVRSSSRHLKILGSYPR